MFLAAVANRAEICFHTVCHGNQCENKNNDIGWTGCYGTRSDLSVIIIWKSHDSRGFLLKSSNKSILDSRVTAIRDSCVIRVGLLTRLLNNILFYVRLNEMMFKNALHVLGGTVGTELIHYSIKFAV